MPYSMMLGILKDFSDERIDREIRNNNEMLATMQKGFDQLEANREECTSQLESLKWEKKRRYEQALKDNFILTEDHLKLLRSMEFKGLWEGDLFSIGVNGKRPFGNSNIFMDIAKILRWRLSKYHDLSYDQEDDARKLLDELPIAVNYIIGNYKL